MFGTNDGLEDMKAVIPPVKVHNLLVLMLQSVQRGSQSHLRISCYISFLSSTTFLSPSFFFRKRPQAGWFAPHAQKFIKIYLGTHRQNLLQFTSRWPSRTHRWALQRWLVQATWMWIKSVQIWIKGVIIKLLHRLVYPSSGYGWWESPF